MAAQRGGEVAARVGDEASARAGSLCVLQRVAQQRWILEQGQDCAAPGSSEASEPDSGGRIGNLGGPSQGGSTDEGRGGASAEAHAVRADEQGLRRLGCDSAGASSGHGDVAAGGGADAESKPVDEAGVMDVVDQAAASPGQVRADGGDAGESQPAGADDGRVVGCSQ